ncbi:MAG: GrpB family protein, partial [Anaerolineae bacterium]
EANAARGDLGYVIDTTSLTVSQVADVIWQNVREAVELVSYDPNWPAQYESEKAHIQAVLGDLAVGIYHIGSTAVPGLAAKPVIDILVTVRRLQDATACVAPLQTLDYTFVDYPQNIDRRFFRKGTPRTHHLHIVEQGGASMIEHLAFRDALRADPELVQRYAELKAKLAIRFKNERAKYSDSKTAFVESVIGADGL